MRLVRSSLATVLAAAALMPSSLEPGQAGSDVAERILQRDEEMAHAVVAGDLGRLEDLYADDYVYVSSDGAQATRSERLEAFRSGTLRYLSTRHTGVRVRVYGDTAIVQGQARSEVLIGGRSVGGDFRYVGVWVRHAGKWRVVLTQATRITG